MDDDKDLTYILESFYRNIKKKPGCDNISATCERCALVVIGGLHPKSTFLSHLMSEGHDDLIAEYEKVNPFSILKKDHAHDVIEDGPIIQLFMSLIKNGYKQNTVLSNIQLISILNKEFNIDVKNTQELQLEIYVNVTKKYLKDWPEWEEFENVVNSMRTGDINDQLTKFLQDKYKRLKEYLANMLGIAKFLASDVVSKLTDKPEQSKEEDKEKYVMQIHANRSQLNNLIQRYPVGNNIFNTPLNIGLCEPSDWTIDSILNSWYVSINVCMKLSKNSSISFKYQNSHILKHNLVNKKLNKAPAETELSTHWHMKTQQFKRQGKSIYSKDLLDSFNKYMNRSDISANRELLSALSKIINRLLPTMPHRILSDMHYTRYLSRYPFLRYLYEDTTAQTDDKYDIQLEEIMTPVCMMNIKFLPLGKEHWNITCAECRVTFEGVDIVEEIVEHYRNYHCAEDCWQCVKCKQVINAAVLMMRNWRHGCPVENIW